MQPAQPNDPIPELPLARYPGESAQAYLGFATFYCLADRKLQNVADAMEVHVGTVKNWSSQFKWNDRLVEQKAKILGHRATAEAALVKNEIAKAEEQASARLDLAARLKHYRDLHQRMLDDYVLQHAEKTRLSELTSFLMGIERLQILHSDFLSNNPQGKVNTAMDAQFDADIAKIYGAKQVVVLAPANGHESDGSGI